MSEQFPNTESQGNLAIKQQLETEVPGNRAVYQSEDGDTTYVFSTEQTLKLSSHSEKQFRSRNQVSNEVANDNSIKGANITIDETSEHTKGSIIPPKFPKTEIVQTTTTAQVVDIHGGPGDSGLMDIARRTKTDESRNFDDTSKVKHTVSAVKTISHAPRGSEGQVYHVKFKDPVKAERYGDLIKQLAAKRVGRAKDNLGTQ